MCECFIGEIENRFADLGLNEGLGKLFSSGIVGEREVDLFIEYFFSLLQSCIIRFVCTSYNSYSIAFGP